MFQGKIVLLRRQVLATFFAVPLLSAAAAPSISINDVSVTEGNSGTVVARFTFRLSAPASETVTVRFGTANGTATAGSDYVSRTGTTTFAPGETSKTQPFTVNGDTVSEGDETFFVNLSSPVGATIAKARGIATIVNDDGAAPPPDTTPDAFSFTPVTGVAPGSVQTSNSITVSGINAASPISVTGGSYSINGGAFVTAAGTVTVGQTVRVQQTAASAASTTTTATLSIGGVSSGYAVTTAAPVQPSVSITDASASEGNSGTSVVRLTLRLSAPSSQTVTVRFATANGTATAGSDYVARTGTTTFAPGETSKTQPFTINGDTAVENDETVLVNLNTPVGLTIAKGQGVITIVNDDAPPSDTTPEPFAFAAVVDAPLGSVQTSNSITVSGINAPSPVTIAGGLYSVDGGSFTDRPGSIVNGARVSVQVLAAYGFSETRTATLNIGGVSAPYSVTTLSFTADGTPDPFRFAPVTGAVPGSVQRSETITVSGINVAAPITVSGGQYRINDGNFTSEPGQVVNGDRVTAELQVSDAPSTASTATISIGGVSADFTATTAEPANADIEPDPFAFAPVFNVEPASTQRSQPIAVSGLGGSAAISVQGGRYSIDGGPFLSNVGSVTNGNSVVVEQVASADYASRREAVLTIGSASAAFEVTTRAIDTTPDAFAFAPVIDAVPASVVISAPVTIRGIDVPVAVSISGGEYSIDNAPFTDRVGDIGDGQSLRLRVTASSAHASTTAAALTVGGVTAVFDVSTSSADTTPDPFSFNSVTAAFPLLATVSEPVTVQGITVPVTASVSGGEYSINNGPFMTLPGPVSAGDRIRLLVIPGANRGEVSTATLNLGGVTDSFSATAAAPIDDDPDIFEFRERSGPRGSVVRSETILVRGVNVATPISVTGGEFSINGGAFRSSAATVRGNDRVTLQASTGTSYDAETRVTVNIGVRSTVWTLRADRDPSRLQAFTLVNASMFAGGAVPPGSVLTTVPITVYNPPSPTAISVTGGLYSINGGPFVSASGTVASGDSVVVQFTAAASYDTAKSVTLKIGSLSSTLSVSTTIDPVAATPTTATDCSAHIYRALVPVSLRLFVCKPAGWRSSDRRSVLMHWFGGGFLYGNTDSAVGEARYWAKNHGMVGIAPDYRVNDRFGTYSYLAADDGRAALQWVQAHADELGIDPARVALSGSSAGGGVAFFAALRDAPVSGSAADNPLMRPAAIVTRAGVPDITTESHIQAYRNADRFADLGPVISPSVNLDAGFPPVLLFHGDRDTTVAPTPSVHFCSSLIRLGIRCEYRNQAGMGHDLSTGPDGLNGVREETRAFLASLGLLPALP